MVPATIHYIVDSTQDRLTESANAGIDLVRSSITWTLGSNFENLTLTGASTINGTGNSLANTITGNSGANLLAGGARATMSSTAQTATTRCAEAPVRTP